MESWSKFNSQIYRREYRPDLLRTVESNLDAIARTPKLHRDELLRHTFMPELIKLEYGNDKSNAMELRTLVELIELYNSLNIEQDPYIVKLRADTSTSNSKQLMKALANRKTYCMDQLKSFCNKSTDILKELGVWPAGYYMNTTIERFCSTNKDEIDSIQELDETQRLYLKKILRRLQTPSNVEIYLTDPWQHETHQTLVNSGKHLCLSAKVECLVDYLAGVATNEFTGLVFVRTRATCAVLRHILALHEKTRDKLRISTFIGISSSPNRKFDIGELIDIKNQTDCLDQLRSGQKNLIIATSVLEEGIDVSACNFVICFEKPPNLRAFIQRRGRARKSKSKYVLMFHKDDDLSSLSTWKQLEDEMRRNYMDEMRRIEELRNIEDADSGRREFYIKSTG